MTGRVLWWGARGMVGVALLPLVLGASLLRNPGNIGALGAHGGSGPPTRQAGRVSLDAVAGAALRGAPFRPDGRPSRVVYDPARLGEPQPNEAPPKPALVLSGIIEGRSPLAVIDGLPGRSGGIVMAEGDTAGGLRIRRIKGGHVTVTGMDTTWVLTVRTSP